MNENIKFLLRNLAATRDRNEISEEEFLLNSVLLQSTLHEWKANFYIKNNAKLINTERHFAWRLNYSAVMQELRLFLITISVILCIVLFNREPNEGMVHNDVRDWSYCDVLDENKCQNGGVLVNTERVFTCQCPCGYYGERCTDRAHERFLPIISILIGDATCDGINEGMRRGMPNNFWSFLPFTYFAERFQRTLISFHQDQLKRMTNKLFFMDVVGNGKRDTMVDFSRILPPSRPLYCPVDARLPPLNTLYDQVFKRERGSRLIQDSKRRNVLFHTFYQFFMLQFFEKDFSATVTGSQLYGSDRATQKELRSMSGGKLKTTYLDGEHYPPQFSFVEKIKKVFTRTPMMVEKWHWFNRAVISNRKPRNRLWSLVTDVYEAFRPEWTVTNPMLSKDRLLFYMLTFWVREHNRVCDELVTRWPEWKDDQLYAVARKTVVAQMMGIMMNDVLPAMNHFSMKYDPELYHDLVPNTNRNLTMPLEMLLTTMLPSGLPEVMENMNKDVNETRQVSMSGMIVRFMVDKNMGLMTCNNDGVTTMPLTKLLIKLSRENNVKSFNDYRRHLGLHPYKSFYELTGNHKTANKLMRLYGNVENVELITGMLTEKKSDDVPTFTVMINSFIINSIITNPLNSIDMWKADTFGGDYGLNLVKSANLKTLICNNLIDKCDDEFIVDIYSK